MLRLTGAVGPDWSDQLSIPSEDPYLSLELSLVAEVGDDVSLVGDLVTVIGLAVAFVGQLLAFVRFALAKVNQWLGVRRPERSDAAAGQLQQSL